MFDIQARLHVVYISTDVGRLPGGQVQQLLSNI